MLQYSAILAILYLVEVILFGLALNKWLILNVTIEESVDYHIRNYKTNPHDIDYTQEAVSSGIQMRHSQTQTAARNLLDSFRVYCLLKRIHKIVKRACELRHILQSARISSVCFGWISWNFVLGLLSRSDEKNLSLVKTGQKYRTLSWRLR